MVPSFLVRYKPNLFTIVQTGYSARVNRPTADFVDPFPRNLFEPSVIRTGNPNLEPEFIHAFELKLSQIKPAWNWEAVLFGQQIENVVREDEDMLTDTTSVITWKNVGMGTNVGMEGRVKFNLFPFWDITLTGLYFRTERIIPKRMILLVHCLGFKVDFPRYSLSVGVENLNWIADFIHQSRFQRAPFTRMVLPT